MAPLFKKPKYQHRRRYKNTHLCAEGILKKYSKSAEGTLEKGWFALALGRENFPTAVVCVLSNQTVQRVSIPPPCRPPHNGTEVCDHSPLASGWFSTGRTKVILSDLTG
jgi:hypothetical protein